MARTRIFPLVALLCAATLVGCARSVTLDTDPGETYAVSVVNPMPHAMIVSFDDGSGARLLGTVGAGRTERFVIAGSANTTVSIIARDEAETHTVRKTVVLRAGSTVEVLLN
ncbi:MAG TPA: hypothetical protein VMM12_15420 [Longimicrobiales bacterium]|nr:hypothetical protein [Longimicrobiales bacterium]